MIQSQTTNKVAYQQRRQPINYIPLYIPFGEQGLILLNFRVYFLYAHLRSVMNMGLFMPTLILILLCYSKAASAWPHPPEIVWLGMFVEGWLRVFSFGYREVFWHWGGNRNVGHWGNAGVYCGGLLLEIGFGDYYGLQLAFPTGVLIGHHILRVYGWRSK